MAKYDARIGELKNLLPNAKNILIALPTNSNVDKLAAGLALFLIFEQQSKQVSVVCDDSIKVAQANLFGVDHIQKNLPQTEGGNLILTLEGVASPDGTVPALEKLDWYAQDSNLNLVFHVLPNQAFQPVKIVPRYSNERFDLIFVLGAANLNSLGNVYQQNQQIFSGTHIVNIDTQSENSNFGQTNILDKDVSSVSEITQNLIADLNLPLDTDIASNLLAGIFGETDNLTNAKASADTFIVIANLLRAGGKKPEVSKPQITPKVDLSALIPKSAPVPTDLLPQVQTQSVNELANIPIVQDNQPITQFQAASNNQPVSDNQQPSPEEQPSGEATITETPEPDWLTPKIFKGSSIG